MTAADIDAIERAAQEALPREDLCGLCGCEDEPYFPKKWEGCNAVNCVRASRLKVQIAYIAAANPAAILSLIARLREAERQRDEARAALEKAQTQSLIVDLANDLRRRGNATTSEEIGVGLHEAATLVEALATHPAFRP